MGQVFLDQSIKKYFVKHEIIIKNIDKYTFGMYNIIAINDKGDKTWLF